MILIGLHGRARAGKDTVGQILVGYGLDRVAFADRIKQMLFCGLDIDPKYFHGPLKEEPIPGLDFSVRVLSQTVGDWGRSLRVDFWIIFAAWEVDACRRMGRSVVITDVRMDNEAEYIRRQGGQIWHIIRHTDPVAAHSSEQGIHPSLIDRTIDNTGTLDNTRRQVAAAYQAAVLKTDPLSDQPSSINAPGLHRGEW